MPQRTLLSSEAIKNLFDVLRTVNLTITAVSLGLISNVFIALNDVPARARTELREVLRIKEEIGSYSVADVLEQIGRQSGVSTGAYRVTLSLDAGGTYFSHPANANIAYPALFHPAMLLGDWSKQSEYGSSWRTQIGSFSNLGQIRSLWDALCKQRYLLVVDPEFNFVGFGQQINGVRTIDAEAGVVRTQLTDAPPVYFPSAPFGGVGPEEAEVTGPILDLIFGMASVDLLHQIGPHDIPSFLKNLSVEEFGRLKIYVQVKAHILSKDPLNFLLAKCSEISSDRVKANRFDEAFPALGALGEHYLSLKLSDLDAILNEESKRSKGELEIFGAKIPSEVVVVIGVPVAVLLLLQFSSLCAYIVQNVASLDSDLASGWSLLLRGSGFMIFGYAACSILPSLAVVLSVVYVTSSTWYRWPVFGSLAIAAIAFGGTSAFNFHRLRRLVRHPGSPPTEAQDDSPSAEP